MEFGINLYSLAGQIKTEEDFLNTLLRLKEMGYSYVQLSGRPVDGEIAKRVSEKAGMPIVLTHSPIARIKDDTENLVKDHASFNCVRVGLGYVNYASMTNDERIAQIKELQKLAEKLNSYGAKFYYHNHHYEFIKLDDGKTIYDHIILQCPDVNLIMDTYWLQTGGVDIVEYVNKAKGRIDCVHLKDYRVTFDAEGKFQAKFAPIGDGNINFKKIIPEMVKAGVKYFLVEQDDATVYDDPFEQVERSIKYLKENFN
ncbi:MAG: sugar phosphate isomerase/epimerase [Clostridia bacterium]|nr:sugar phosphate isomerase/epimerase [Clostridia bacterium]